MSYRNVLFLWRKQQNGVFLFKKETLDRFHSLGFFDGREDERIREKRNRGASGGMGATYCASLSHLCGFCLVFQHKQLTSRERERKIVEGHMRAQQH